MALQRLAMECNAAYSPLQRVFGIGHTFTDLILSMTLQRRMPASRSLVKSVKLP